MRFYLLLIPAICLLLSCSGGSPGLPDNKKPAYGIDISKYQKNLIDFLNEKKDSLDFIICKATEDATGVDPDFSTNWETIANKGFIRGAYHFYHCGTNGGQQADNYVTTVKTFAKTDLPPIVDFEEQSINTDCAKTEIQKELLNFLMLIEQKTGRKPILYTDNNTADLYISDTLFSGYALWIANPSERTQPLLPKTWEKSGWSIWQKSWKYAAAVKDTSDFDVFNGDRDSLIKFINLY
jgi:lysozyme